MNPSNAKVERAATLTDAELAHLKARMETGHQPRLAFMLTLVTELQRARTQLSTLTPPRAVEREEVRAIVSDAVLSGHIDDDDLTDSYTDRILALIAPSPEQAELEAAAVEYTKAVDAGMKGYNLEVEQHRLAEVALRWGRKIKERG